jgi:hypothetical protein
MMGRMAVEEGGLLTGERGEGLSLLGGGGRVGRPLCVGGGGSDSWVGEAVGEICENYVVLYFANAQGILVSPVLLVPSTQVLYILSSMYYKGHDGGHLAENFPDCLIRLGPKA